MMLNKPMVDWLTLTTFERKNADVCRMLFARSEPEKRLQYDGWSDRYGLFLGAAIQRGVPHFMFQASGEAANKAMTFLHNNTGPYDFNVTRIDLQVTIPIARDFAIRPLYDAIAQWDTEGRPRQATVIQSGDGLDTLYIGSRTSDRFTRIYVKPIDGGLRALRFECEFKGDHAHRVYNDCRMAVNVARILRHEVEYLPGAQNQPLAAFLRALGPEAHRPEIKRVMGENSTLSWLQTQVAPTIERLCNSHEYGDATRRLVKSWYNGYCVNDNNE